MDANSSKITVITTFNQKGLEVYAQRMIDGFSLNWPKEVDLIVYAEKCQPIIPNSQNIFLKNLDEVIELTNFKEKWKNVPKANGDVSSDPIRSKRRDSGKGFKWHAIRFSHKVYAIFDCARTHKTDILIWMDADTVCHSKINLETVKKLVDNSYELNYLGRKGKFSECGLYSMDLRSINVRNFLKEFQRCYDDAENGIFLLDEWHDSFVFDAVRRKFPQMKQNDWSKHLTDLRPRLGSSPGEGHPLINSEWGAYLDHLKGDDRKKLGHSKPEDVKVMRSEAYWKSFIRN